MGVIIFFDRVFLFWGENKKELMKRENFFFKNRIEEVNLFDDEKKMITYEQNTTLSNMYWMKTLREPSSEF